MLQKKSEETTLFTTDLFSNNKEVITPKSEIKDTNRQIQSQIALQKLRLIK